MTHLRMLACAAALGAGVCTPASAGDISQLQMVQIADVLAAIKADKAAIATLEPSRDGSVILLSDGDTILAVVRAARCRTIGGCSEPAVRDPVVLPKAIFVAALKAHQSQQEDELTRLGFK